MKRGIFFVVFAVLFLLIKNADAQECFPDYKCGEWKACIEGLQSRTCTDIKCNGKDIIDRKFCEELNCKPRIQCSEWSGCFYTDKIEDIFGGKIKFGGYKSRTCVDSTGCVDSFSEEGLCEETFDLDIKKVSYCGLDYMVAIDPLSKKEIVRINLESWKKKRLDLSFSSGDLKYCPSCYNGAKDNNETDIDCGGDCRVCKGESKFSPFILIILFWGVSLIFSILLTRELILIKKNSETYINGFAY